MRLFSTLLAVATLIAWLTFQLQFISADPQFPLAGSGRGDFTDEGINTLQLRNYINHGHFNIRQSDGFEKTPLFNVFLFLPFTIFGTHLETARISVLGLVLVCLLLIGRWKGTGTLLLTLLIPFSLYIPFQYAHMGMAEIPSALFIVLSLICFEQYFMKQQKRIWLVRAHLFLFFSWLFKLQFLYVVLIPCIALLPLLVRKRDKELWRSYFVSVGIITLSIILYFITFFLPEAETMLSYLHNQAAVFRISIHSPELFKWNVMYHLLNPVMEWFTILYIVSLITSFYMFKKGDDAFRLSIALGVTWSAIELLKLMTMTYLPYRYLVSLWFSFGWITVLVLIEIKKRYFINKSFYGFIPFMAALLLPLLIYYWGINLDPFVQRTFVTKSTNTFLAKNVPGDKLFLGPWASTFNWDCKAYAVPVWYHSLNDKDPIQRFHPFLVFSEPDEEDSQEAYKSQNIHLSSISDSVKQVSIGNYMVNLYWIKK